MNEAQVKIRDTILERMPREAEVTRVEFEGPRLAIYVKNVVLLLENSYVITDIVNLLHKRIVIRSDPSIRLPELEADKVIREIVPRDAEITAINFDPSLGEVVIEAKKPGLAIGKEGSTLQEIIKSTCWRPRVLRAPPIPSKIIASARNILHTESEERSRVLREIGERIFRPTVARPNTVMVTALGAFHEVGRSCILLETDESRVLLDCGMHPGAQDPLRSFPRLDADQFDPTALDAVVVSHAHLDHSALLPFLYKYGYDGPVYCSEPTSSMMTLLQLDFLEVCSREGAYAPFDQKDVKETVMHTIPVNQGVVTDIAPDIKLTLHNAGHILGSSIIHLHIGEGLHNVVYTGDLKYARSMLFEAAHTQFPRVETLITESTYGGPNDIMPDRETVEGRLVHIVNETFEKGGKVLIPSLAVGRAQEIMLVLDKYMKLGKLKEAPVYMEGMIAEATAIHTAYPEYLSRDLRDKILHEDINPFQSQYFTTVNHPSERDPIVKGGPCVVMATSGMLEGGPAVDYFQRFAEDPRNTTIFVSYQIEGTMGNRVKAGMREVPLMSSNGKMNVVKVNMRIESVEGFSGHSDRNQLLNFISRMQPKPSKVIVCHGERRKCDAIAQAVSRYFRARGIAPEILETIRLR